jgi:anti-sigma B factor antagonist
METTVRHTPDGAAVVQVSGRLNMVSAGRLREQVESLVDDGSTVVVVDLTDVVFLDSSGLGALISGVKAARRAGGDLRIAGPTEQVRLVLQLTNMERVLIPHPSVESALQHV